MMYLCITSTLNFCLKNNQHRFEDINKTVRAYAIRGTKRCLVKLLDYYLSLLPPDSPYFYMQGLEKFPSNSCVYKTQ